MVNIDVPAGVSAHPLDTPLSYMQQVLLMCTISLSFEDLCCVAHRRAWSVCCDLHSSALVKRKLLLMRF